MAGLRHASLIAWQRSGSTAMALAAQGVAWAAVAMGAQIGVVAAGVGMLILGLAGTTVSVVGGAARQLLTPQGKIARVVAATRVVGIRFSGSRRVGRWCHSGSRRVIDCSAVGSSWPSSRGSVCVRGSFAFPSGPSASTPSTHSDSLLPPAMHLCILLPVTMQECIAGREEGL